MYRLGSLEWKEAKGFRFYLVDGDRIEHILSWHQVQSNKTLKESLKEVKEAELNLPTRQFVMFD
jgi:hypothetical protein